MQLPTFDPNNYCWDAWRAPHIQYAHNFVQFDTGELIATRWYCRDRYYAKGSMKDLGVQVLVSADIASGFFTGRNDAHKVRIFKTPDGEKVLPTWFPSGRGYIYDESAQMLVKTGDLQCNPFVPSRFQKKASAYWAGSGREPVGAELRLTKPRKRTPEEKEKLEDIRALCKAWRKLTDEGKQWTDYHTNAGVSMDLVVDKEFDQLADHVKVKIAQNGFHGPWETITVPYLKVETV